MAIDVLFRPFTHKGLSLPNRVVMAPMTRSFSPNGVVTADVAQYYRRRAEGGVGLIISEGTGVDRPASLNDPNVPRFHGVQELAGWRRIVDEVHDAGGLMAPQLWHVGAVRTREKDWQPPGAYDSPSGLSRPEKNLGVPMSDEDIADAIRAFADAALAAKRSNFDAVELHGAHGYLIDQFFWEGTNRREDAYGGRNLPGRARFAADIVRAVRKSVGPEFPILLRISQWKQQDFAVKLASTPRELEAWLMPLREAGVDILHCSQRRFWEAEFEGSDLNFAGWAKKVTGLPTISVGSVGLTGEFIAAYGGESSRPASLDELVRRLDREEFDLVAVGRALLQDPQWLLKVRDGRAAELMAFDRSAFATLS
ncbi:MULTISPECIES: NADH:flavin oxidoreductase [unclassified Bradyrhizobium]|uniref:NADH:flavin oxidoreductase n=1 Tax=unclassified Bradyrhizobium TaxID=2631580 RepID=UPI001FF62463|nr:MULTISPECIES: NADH:flavin oxidoreductase [unclassified Bradyrhizobium]MCJ9705986.1 NADH:flavin oxidoreductase [Bradyrhizobium sp. SHOUNA76]MCJ9734445.1 NADH:flavin oxidoreductase [Bradyrhizobium sp. PRIMUS42]